MFKENTVLILGAGANIHLGFPSGDGLVETICNLDPSPLVDIYRNDSIPKASSIHKNRIYEVKQFQQSLKKATCSIDTFIQNNSKFDKLGRTCIAMSLSPNELDQNLFAFEEGEDIRINIKRNPLSKSNWIAKKNWYRVLLRELLRGANSNNFTDNRLSIVTFNYERSLDYFLYIALKNNFGSLPKKEILKLYKSIKIVHVYGSLGELDITSKTGIGYCINPNDNLDYYRYAADQIKIIGTDNDLANFTRAREIIADAKYVYFFGFGFDDQNMRYLQVQDWPDGKIIGGTHKDIRANNFASKVDNYIKKFNNNELIHKTSDKRYNNYYKPHWYDGTIDEYLMNIGFNYQSLSS